MSDWIVENRETGQVVYAYTADAPTDFPEYPFSIYNHSKKPAEEVPMPGRRVSKLEFVARLGDPAFTVLIEMAPASSQIAKLIKMIDWATPEPDGTSIDLDDPRVQSIADVEAVLVGIGVVEAGWAAGVLA